MQSTIANSDDAQIILKLYELRAETVMRKARQWMTVEFWPSSAQDVLAILENFGSQENQYFRQVTSYWEMAAAFVNYGSLDGELFLDSGTGEGLFLLAKFWPFMDEIRKTAPHFLRNTEQLTVKYPEAKQRMDGMMARMAKRRAGSAQQKTTATPE